MIKTLRIKLAIGFLLAHLAWIPTQKADAKEDDPNRFMAMAMAGMITDIIIDPKKMSSKSLQLLWSGNLPRST